MLKVGAAESILIVLIVIVPLAISGFVSASFAKRCRMSRLGAFLFAVSFPIIFLIVLFLMFGYGVMKSSAVQVGQFILLGSLFIGPTRYYLLLRDFKASQSNQE